MTRVRWNGLINNILILGVGGVGVDGVLGYGCSGDVYRRNSWNGSEVARVWIDRRWPWNEKLAFSSHQSHF
jgi:hypothetical protein